MAGARGRRARGRADGVSAEPRPLVIVLHGPSGVGKDTVIARLRERTGIHRATSSNSRLKREGEVDGVDYHFLTPEEFRRKIEANEFIEHAQVYDDLKGLERRELEGPLAEGRDVLVRTDLQGARSLRGLLRGAVFVLLTAESREALRTRLTARETETAETLARRLAEVDEELADAPNNDYVVVNREGALEEAVDELVRIIERERGNPNREAAGVRA
ncbi:MAG: guanylate kinase [Dehalococcoidia bacterium]|nr:guanylate kinase [Dehalococcoidia bacterium]MYD29002.1 guanylate kinase [Dehalococcoidia bacterium]